MQTISVRCTTLSATFIGIAALLLASAAWAVSGAGFTTVDVTADGGNFCSNGNPTINCNLYDGKQYVWLNGGALTGQISTDGTYFWAVLAPGGQPNPLDGSAKNLSDDCDAATNREFSLSGGTITFFTTHTVDGNLVRVGVGDSTGSGCYFGDTPNPGGVYILAICRIGDASATPISLPSTISPSQCKYDAFKVKVVTPPPPPELPELDVFKFCDANANGFLDIGEVGLPGWAIQVTDGATCSGTTDSSGFLQCTTLPPDTYFVSETVKSGFVQTATCLDEFCGTCSAHPAQACQIDSDCPAFATGETCKANGAINPFTVDTTGGPHEVDFGNVGQSTISGSKTDGTTGLGVSGIKILLSGTASACAITDSTGNYSFPNLLPGTYTVTEVPPANSVPVGDTSCNNIVVAVDATTCEGSTHTCNFENICLGAGGGHTLGFWSNKNGFTTLNDGGTIAPELGLLDSLNLVDASCNAFDPNCFCTTGHCPPGVTADCPASGAKPLRTWLLSATATNMAYMLSAQLAAMELNVEAGFVSGSALVFAGPAPAGCTVPGLSPQGFITINDLMADANTELGADGCTLAGDPNRTCQEFKKNALDAANNNQNFEVACPPGNATCDPKKPQRNGKRHHRR